MMPTKSIIAHTLSSNAALQLVFCYIIGFGTTKVDGQAMSILHDQLLEDTDLKNQIEHQLIADDIRMAPYKSGLYPKLESEGTVAHIDLPQYYRERNLLRRAEISHKLDIQTIQLVFGQSHELCLMLKSCLASIYRNQGRWKKAEKLQARVVEMSKKVLSEEHPKKITSTAKLA